ncbi:MAG: glycerophosphodiester phosphodiesterase [Candidatus Obscuribacterales bacterium]|nr:glycerophosphodiester phosphodiesterase [Cyanobacteria bacterium SZAS LIN-5]RTL44599.1 MAG: glycerophosphodiester phosphodiesterase [Candidatus Melainabacteria bacterium]
MVSTKLNRVFGIFVVAVCSITSANLSAQALPQVVAHRGGRVWAPENTLAAFKKSVELGADGIELDIHRCKTGELVVIHDESVDRTTDGSGFVKDMSLSQLRALSAGAKWAPASQLRKLSAGIPYSSEFKNEKLPLLTEVFDLVKGKLTINIEIKNAPVDYPGIEDDLIALLKKYPYPDKIMVSSFDHDVIRRFHEKAPQYKCAILTDCILSDVGSYAKSVGADNWNPGFGDFRTDAAKRAHEAGLKVNVWTVNAPEEWKSAVAMPVDGIITDDPEGLKKFLHTEPTTR